MHMRLFHSSPALAMVAVRACRYDICPQVLTAHMARHHMIHRQPAVSLPTVLAGIMITPEDFTPRQFDVRTRSMNLVLKPDDRRTWDQLSDCFDMSASIHDHPGFTSQEQTDGAACRTDIDRFKIGI